MPEVNAGHDPSGPQVLALGRYRFTAAFESALELPGFAGPLLRSVFGAALRRGACVTGAADCKPCPLLHRCAYPALMQTPPRPTQFEQRFVEVPNPYVIEPPPLDPATLPAGEPLVWHQVLVGADALRQMPLLLQAWQRALHSGVGPRRVRGMLLSVELVEASGAARAVWSARTSGLQPHHAHWTLPVAPVQFGKVHLHLHTPLRLQHQGQPLRPAQLNPRTLVSHLLRRCNLMLDLHLGIRPAPFDAHALVELASRLADDRSALLWTEQARWSSRQRQEMPLGGVTGTWALQGELAPLMPWLHLGEWLHLGKAATMGLGGYRVEEAPST